MPLRSGTPIQNSLRELWSLFDFIYPGRLGSLPVFEVEFCEPIRAGGFRSATRLQAEVAVRCAATLQRIVRPYLLRRKKDDVSAVAKLPQKTEQVLFCRLSERQRDIYRTILSSPEVSAVLENRTMPFRAINTLRKLCNHPALVYRSGRVVWHDLPSGGADCDDDGAPAGGIGVKKRKRPSDSNGDGPLDPSDLVWEESGKLMVLSRVLPLWFSEGHKVLLFSQTQSMLNLLEVMMKSFSFRFLRLDGSTPVAKREGIIDKFNSDPTVFLMILSTRTGGVGISLTAANRVVIVDPDWNPQTDCQARERAWRLGQLRDVTVYRLISRGTIEEKIYQRQIFKLLLSSRILDDPKQKALFSKSDIKELFTLAPDDAPSAIAAGARAGGWAGAGSSPGSAGGGGEGGGGEEEEDIILPEALMKLLVKLQAVVRGHLVRRKLSREWGVVRLQALARGFLVRIRLAAARAAQAPRVARQVMATKVAAARMALLQEFTEEELAAPAGGEGEVLILKDL